MPVEDITLRRLEAGDAELFRAIRLESLARSPEAYGSALEVEERRPLAWFADRLAQSLALGAFQGGELIGIAGFAIEEGPKRQHKGHVWGVYVRANARGKGVARRLCAAIITSARREVEILHLTVTGGNEVARRLYSRLGFVEYGVEKRSLKVGGRYYDDVLMAKELN